MNGVVISKGEQITIEKMIELQKAYEEREKNIDKIIFDSVVGNILDYFLDYKIGIQGPATTFSFTMDYQGYIHGRRWWINNRWVEMKMDDSKAEKLLEYVKERLQHVFPDYVVCCEFKMKNNGFCFRKQKNIWIGLGRRDYVKAENTKEKVEAQPKQEKVSEKDVLLS